MKTTIKRTIKTHSYVSARTANGRPYISMLLSLALASCLFGAWCLTCAAAPPGSSSNTGSNIGSGDIPLNAVYVSPTGNDRTATGSIDAPYKSINVALDSIEPGDTVLLRGGTYREGSNVRVRTPNITITSAPGEWAVIDLTTYDPGNDEDSGVYFDVDSSGGKLLNVEVKGGFYAVCMETKWDWGDPSDRAGASNIVIEGCVLHDSQYDVVKVKPNCNNVMIRNNEIYNSGQAFAGRPQNGEDNAEGIDNVNGDNMVVRNNYIHDICSTAVYAKGGATDALIENNHIERAHGAGIMVGFDTSPEFFDTGVNSQYYENIRGVVRNNLIVDTGWEGIGLYASIDAQIYNNTLVNVCNGGQYHSAIYFGLSYQDWESYAGRPSNVNPDIHHNIVSQPSGFVLPMIEIRYADELGGLSALNGNPVMNNNCYYVAGKSAVFEDRRPRNILENAGFSSWQSHINGDAGSIESDPALDSDYLPSNPQCAGIGITVALSELFDQTGIPDISVPVTRSMGNFKKINSYSLSQFSDVDENAWYGFYDQKSILNAYEHGLMRGNSDATFNPAGNLNIAEAITVAARVHSIYMTGEDNFTQGSPWYQVYVDYAIDNGIIAKGAFSDYTVAITRERMADIFSRSLPETELASQNTVDSLPDVNNANPYYNAIIMLYEAGVLTGSDDLGTFSPSNNINRAEAAAIISRVILPETRSSEKTFG